jgi:hypothetical protein
MPGPYNFESQPKFLRNLVLSANKQAAWNAALADAALTRRQRFDGAAILEQTITRRSDQGYAGKGTSFATNGQITSYDTKFDGFKAELSDWLAGFLPAFAMGKDTVTGAGPYTHVFTFDESTRTAVPTTVYLEDTEDVHYKCPDMCVNDVTLTIGDIGAITAEMTMMGTGRQILGSMTDGAPALPAETYLLGSDGALSLNGTSLIGRHMSTTFKLENQLTVHKAPGGGLYGIFVRKGDPKFSISTTIAAKDVDDVYALFSNDTVSDFELVVNSGASAQMTISIPQTHLKTTKLGFDGDMVVWQIEADDTTCYQNAGVPPVSVTVINGVATYLTTPA